MFNSSEVKEEKNFISKYITCGVQELRINSLEIKYASTGSKQVIFNVEGPEVKDLGFEGEGSAKGQVGRVTTSYMKPEQEQGITTTFARIADAMGTRDKLNAITPATLEEYVEAANKILTGQFANFVVGGEEYQKDNNKVGIRLNFPKYNFVEKVGTTPTTVKFDTSNAYHYKKLIIPDNIVSKTIISDPNDLPF